MRIAAAVFIILAVLAGGSLYTAENKSITVAGFINKGEKSYDNMNMIISKSLILLFSKIPGVKITSFEESQKSAEELEFFKGKNLDPETAVGIGMKHNSKQVITGDYRVDKKSESILINVAVYDVVTGELKLKRKYEGSAGIDIFDTIDKMNKNIGFLLLGKTIKTGKLSIKTDVPGKTYKIYVNGNYQKDLNSGTGYEDTILAGEKVEVSLRYLDDKGEKEVFRDFITVKENETYPVVYSQSGSVIIKAVDNPGARIYLDGVLSGEADRNGDFTIHNVKAGVEHNIRVEKEGKILEARNMKVGEGESPALVIGNSQRSVYFPVKLITGGIGAAAGVEFVFLKDLSADISIGCVYMIKSAAIIPVAELGVSWRFLSLGGINLRIHTAGFGYINPFIASPLAMIEAEWNQVFIEAGMRYSFESIGGGPYLMMGAGYRF